MKYSSLDSVEPSEDEYLRLSAPIKHGRSTLKSSEGISAESEEISSSELSPSFDWVKMLDDDYVRPTPIEDRNCECTSKELPQNSLKSLKDEKTFFNTPYTFPDYLERKRKEDSQNPMLKDQVLPNQPEDGRKLNLKKGKEAKECKVGTIGNKRVVATQEIPKERTKVQGK